MYSMVRIKGGKGGDKATEGRNTQSEGLPCTTEMATKDSFPG